MIKVLNFQKLQFDIKSKQPNQGGFTMYSSAGKRSISAIIFALLLSITALSYAGDKPNIVIMATGGTIAGSAESNVQAGYSSGQVGVEVLINAVPELKKLANIKGEQISNIGSQDMNDQVWLKLAKRINAIIKDKNVDGIVITHGTDTMEETAYFLNLVVKCKKPVVLTGSMRPSTALSADGPLNIYNAVAVAADKAAWDRGVLVVANDKILGARSILKTSATDVETFKAPGFGWIGTVHYGVTRYYRKPFKLHTYQTEFSIDKDLKKLPKVDIIYMYSNASGDLIEDAVENGAQAIVIAGVGNGNMTAPAVKALAAAVKKGVVCVRSSRVPSGYIDRNVELDDDALGFLASYQLSPQKSRVLLKVALLKTKDPKVIQEYFSKY
jgi:L-asparaginase